MTSSPPPTLNDMPSDVLTIIFGYSGFLTIQTLRKVCHDLRNYIDDVKPDSNLQTVSIDACAEHIAIVLETNREEKYTITYSKHLTGCLVEAITEHKTKEKFLDKENFIKIFNQDLGLIFQFLGSKSSILEFLYLKRDKDQGRGVQRSDETLEKILEHLKSILSIRLQQLRVHALKLKVTTQNHVMSILPYLEPVVLEEIQIFDPSIGNELHTGTKSMEIGEIVELEQWKGAKELKMRQFLVVGPIAKLAHFTKAEMALKEINMEDLIEMKNAFQKSPNFQSFSISFGDFRGYQQLQNVFGAPQLNQNRDRIGWFFKFPDPSNVLTMFYFPGQFTVNFCLFNSRMVPRGAIVKE